MFARKILMMDYLEGLPADSLNNLLIDINARLLKESASKSKDSDVIEGYKEQLKAIAQALAKLNSTNVGPSVQTSPNLIQIEHNRRIKEISDYCSKLSEFGPGKSVTLFIKECQNIYDLVVQDKPELESEFCRRIRAQFCSDFASSANDYSASGKGTLDTFSKLKEYLRETYECKASAYQLYQKFDSLEKGDSETISDFARRVQRVNVETRSLVFDKFKRFQKQSVKAEHGAETEMSASQLMDFMAGQLVLRAIKSDTECYNHLVAADLDKCWNAQDIANRAAYFVSNRTKSDPLFTESEPKVNFARKNLQNYRQPQKSDRNQERKKDPCPHLMRGNCVFRHNCEFDHDPNRIKSYVEAIIRVAAPKENAGQKSVTKSQQKSGNNGKKSWDKSRQVHYAENQIEASENESESEIVTMPGFH